MGIAKCLFSFIGSVGYNIWWKNRWNGSFGTKISTKNLKHTIPSLHCCVGHTTWAPEGRDGRYQAGPKDRNRRAPRLLVKKIILVYATLPLREQWERVQFWKRLNLKIDLMKYNNEWRNYIQDTFQISDMTKTFSLLLSLVFVATAQHLDSTRRGGEKVGEYLDQAVDSRIIYPGYFR